MSQYSFGLFYYNVTMTGNRRVIWVKQSSGITGVQIRNMHGIGGQLGSSKDVILLSKYNIGRVEKVNIFKGQATVVDCF